MRGAASTSTSASWASLLCRVALGLVMILAATGKIADPQQFAMAIDKFDVPGFRIGENDLPVAASAFFVPWLELVAGLCLLAGLWTRAASALMVVMLAVFSAAIWSAALDRGLSLDCGCFGKLKGFCRGDAGWCNIIQNGVLASFGLVGLIVGGGRASADALLVRQPAAPPPESPIDFG
jgi:uncharacterized membrane protein YphA (DoxX/SURF4 family)